MRKTSGSLLNRPSHNVGKIATTSPNVPHTATTVAVCGTFGLVVAIFPTLWLGLFSNDPDVFRIGGLYLHIVAPTYFFFGAGLSLFYVSLGLGRGAAAAGANAVRLAVNVTGGLIAVYWLELGMVGFFASVALGFAVYAALLVWAVLRVIANPRERNKPSVAYGVSASEE